MNSQILSDEEAIIQRLQGKNIDGKYTWRPKDKELKKLAIDLILKKEDVITEKGLMSLSFILTGDEYDDPNDSFFLNRLISFTDVEIISKECAFITSHFKRSLYNNESIEKLSQLAKPQEILKWNSWTPYYLCFLGIDNIELTINFVKENLNAINHLHFVLYNDPYRFDTFEMNVCLARLGKLDDTMVINQLTRHFDSTETYQKDYRKYIENLSRIRTPLAFQKIGGILISDLEEIISVDQRTIIKQMALASFLVYVKNFLDRSTKIQETINLWRFVKFSKFQGKDFSTNEYMERAKNWYIENKDNLIIDYDKY